MPRDTNTPKIPNFAALEVALADYLDRQAFLVWRAFSSETSGKFSKLPVDPETGLATAPNTAKDRGVMTFKEARDAVRVLADLDLPVGIGIFPPNADLTAGDLDNCAANGVIADWAQPIIGDGYAEFSPSGTGVRLLISDVSENLAARANGHERHGIGFYGAHTSKFVTLTGSLVDVSAPRPIQEYSAEAEAAVWNHLAKMDAKKGPASAGTFTGLYPTGRAGMELALEDILTGTSLHPATVAFVSKSVGILSRSEAEDALHEAYQECKAKIDDMPSGAEKSVQLGRWGARYPTSIEGAFAWLDKRPRATNKLLEIPTQKAAGAREFMRSFSKPEDLPAGLTVEDAVFGYAPMGSGTDFTRFIMQDEYDWLSEWFGSDEWHVGMADDEIDACREEYYRENPDLEAPAHIQDAMQAEVEAQAYLGTAADALDLFSEAAVPPFPLGTLPPEMAAEIRARCQRTRFDASVLASASLVAVAAALGANVKIKVNSDWSERLVIWMNILGAPSAKKTPPLDAALSVLAGFDRVNAQNRADAIGRILANKDMSKKDKDEEIRKIPFMRRYITTDPTLEKLADILGRGDQKDAGILLKRDELVGWIGSMDAYKAGGKAEMDRGKWLTAASGGFESVDRVGRGEVVVGNFAVSVVGTMQPERLLESSKKYGLQTDGLMQRFLFTYAHDSGLARLSEDDEAEVEIPAYLADRIRRDFACHPAYQKEPYTLSRGARVVFNEITDYLAAAQAIPDIGAGFNQWLGKAQSRMARLTLLYAILWQDKAEGYVIGEHAAKMAAEAMRGYFIPTAMMTFDATAGTAHDADTKAIARWILKQQASGATEVETRYASKSGPRCLRISQDEVRKKLEIFVSAGWLSLRADAQSFQRGLRPSVLVITPGLSARFAKELEAAQAVHADLLAKLAGEQ